MVEKVFIFILDNSSGKANDCNFIIIGLNL